MLTFSSAANASSDSRGGDDCVYSFENECLSWFVSGARLCVLPGNRFAFSMRCIQTVGLRLFYSSANLILQFSLGACGSAVGCRRLGIGQS